MKLITLEILSYFLEKIKSIFVAKEEGKGLSTNDYTTEEKEKLAGLENYSHPNSGVTAGTYKSVTVDAQGHVTGGTNPTTLEEYGITDAASINHTHDADDITSVNADAITGVISIDNLPQGALERLVVVEDDDARFALTTTEVQKGDTVKVTSTGLMYFVKDDTQLGTEAGYEPYTAGAATSVPWSGVTGKPESFTPSTHTHITTDITDFPESMKNPNALTISLNGASQGAYDGSEAKSIDITAASIGAITEDDMEYATTGEIDELFTA